MKHPEIDIMYQSTTIKTRGIAKVHSICMYSMCTFSLSHVSTEIANSLKSMQNHKNCL